MPRIRRLDAIEILDSRGRPTVQAFCHLAGGAVASAQVPSGASTGAGEALELRDGDPHRHRGLGCLRAVNSIRDDIHKALAGREFPDQASLDDALREVDGTPDKTRLGANAILGVSLAFARSHAVERGVPLYCHLADLAGLVPSALPRPTINLFSGGKHAGAQVAIQDVLVVPGSADTMADALAQACAVFHAAAGLVARKYGARALVADEGGLAPDFPDVDSMLEDAVQAVVEAGFQPGRDIALAVDIASTHFFDVTAYCMDGRRLDSDQMIAQLEHWVDRYPIISVEDGLAEDDWDHWPRLRSRLESHAWVLGDDLLCTNPVRIRRAVTAQAANALLLKVNQIGTLTEANEARRLARDAGWHVTISARSGETEDDWLADLATGWAGDHIKVGSVTRSERLAKYNRLLAIEKETRFPIGAVGWPPRFQNRGWGP